MTILLILGVIDVVQKNLDKEMIVGYTVQGESLTKAAYNKRLQKAEKQILSGDYQNQDDLEKKSKNW